MDISKVVLIDRVKTVLKWVFFCVLYPYIVMSVVYGKGVGVTGLLFSYITIVPTLFVIKLMRVAREKSIDLNELIANFTKRRLDDGVYAKVIIALKVTRKIILILLGIFFIKLLFTIFNISSFVSSSLNAYLIALLQLYYMAIVMARIRYEV